MRRRYVFWRTPAGKAYRGADQRHSLVEVLAEIGRTSKVIEGRIEWVGFTLHRFETSLKAALVVLGPDGEELNDTDAWSVIWAGLRASIKKRGGGHPVAPSDLLREADSEAAAFFRKTLSRYTLVTSLSVASLPAKTSRIHGSVLAECTGAKRFTYPPALRYHQRSLPPVPAGYQRVCVKTYGRSIHEATSKALADVTLLRGLWTLFSTYGSWSISVGSTKRKALGVIHTGPIHTLHQPTGEPVEDIFWYEPDYLEAAKPFRPSKGWVPIEQHRKWAMRRINLLPYRGEMEGIIGRYAVALDQINLDIAFLHLWSILEKLTDTVGTDYDETVRRAVWPFSDRRLAGEMLKAMRLHRNRLVHAARSSDDRDQVAYLVKSFVEPHLLRLIRNDFRIGSLEEYGRHLAFPTNLESLERQHRQVGHALRWMRKSLTKT